MVWGKPALAVFLTLLYLVPKLIWLPSWDFPFVPFLFTEAK